MNTKKIKKPRWFTAVALCLTLMFTAFQCSNGNGLVNEDNSTQTVDRNLIDTVWVLIAKEKITDGDTLVETQQELIGYPILLLMDTLVFVGHDEDVNTYEGSYICDTMTATIQFGPVASTDGFMTKWYRTYRSVLPEMKKYSLSTGDTLMLTNNDDTRKLIFVSRNVYDGTFLYKEESINDLKNYLNNLKRNQKFNP